MIKLFQKLILTPNYMQKFYIDEEEVMKGWVIMLSQIRTY